jgi:hypothetical protein
VVRLTDLSAEPSDFAPMPGDHRPPPSDLTEAVQPPPPGPLSDDEIENLHRQFISRYARLRVILGEIEPSDEEPGR